MQVTTTDFFFESVVEQLITKRNRELDKMSAIICSIHDNLNRFNGSFYFYFVNVGLDRYVYFYP